MRGMKKSAGEIERVLAKIGAEEELHFDEFQNLLKGSGRFAKSVHKVIIQDQTFRLKTNDGSQAADPPKTENKLMTEQDDPNDVDPLSGEPPDPGSIHAFKSQHATSSSRIGQLHLSALLEDHEEMSLLEIRKSQAKGFLRGLKNLDHHMRWVFPLLYILFLLGMFIRQHLSPIKGNFTEFASPKNYADA